MPRHGIRWQDVVCVAWLYATTLHLIPRDGGKELHALVPGLLLTPLVLFAARPAVARASGRELGAALLWVVAPAVSFAFADIRAGWVPSMAVWALAVPTTLVVLHLLARPWGRPAILLTFALLGLAGWYHGALVWYGGGSNAQGEPAWMALSWHNQSGALMGALGVGAAAFALLRTGLLRAVAVVIAPAGLAAVWLSGSRGAILATGLALGCTGIGALRRTRSRRGSVGVALAVVAALSVGGVVALGEIYAGEGVAEQPVLARSQAAGSNLAVRIAYWRAALEMIREAPVTGTGPGSYRWSAYPYFEDTTGPTSSAHNEQLESWAELGVAGGAAILILTGAALLLSLRAVGRRTGSALEVAAAGVTTLLVAHAAIDFDWSYPVLFVMLVASVTILGASCRGAATAALDDRAAAFRGADLPRDAAPRLGVGHRLLLVGATVLACGSAVGVLVEREPGLAPWDLDRRLLLLADLALVGEVRPAEEHLARVRHWNPGSHRLAVADALIRQADGRLDGASLAASVEPRETTFVDQVHVARQLLETGHPALASDVIEGMRPVLAERRSWRVEAHVARVALLDLDITYASGGCDAVRARRPSTERWAEALEVVLPLADPGPDERPLRPWLGCLTSEASS